MQKWYTASVVEVRDHELLIAYDGWGAKFQEWLPRWSDRLAPHKSNGSCVNS